jgi:hypothetical protein
MNQDSTRMDYTCPEFFHNYVGQTGRRFENRFKEHITAFKTYSNSSRFAQHLLENSHAMGFIEDIMMILHLINKDPHLNTLEKYYIYWEKKEKEQRLTTKHCK